MISTDIGVWISAIIILGYLTVIWKENIFYRLASFTVVGLAAAYTFAMAIDSVNKQSIQLILQPNPEYIQIIVLIFSLLSLLRLSGTYGWVSRYPTAFILGLGLSLAAGPQTRILVDQIAAAVTSLLEADPLLAASGWLALIATITTLFYFTFTAKVRGNRYVGYITKIGRYFFMIAVGGLCGAYVVGNLMWMGEALKTLVWNWLGLQP